MDGKDKDQLTNKAMEQIIIITECTCPYGKYWKFVAKDTGICVAEVDRKKRSEVDGPLYWTFESRGGELHISSKHSSKDAAISQAIRNVKEHFVGHDVSFKWNVMCERYHW